MAQLVEHGGYCRMCGDWRKHSTVDPAGLVLAHLKPNPRTKRSNCTIACRRCDIRMGTGDWTGTAPSVGQKPKPTWRPTAPPFPHPPHPTDDA